MRIETDYDLTRFNTFGIVARAKYFIEIESEADLKDLFISSEFKNNKRLFLGGGSNVLFTSDFDGLVALNKMKGVEILEDGPDYVIVRSMSGEIWHDLVNFTVTRGYWGIENLSLIPGTVGAAPMQNIGAYGAELRDTLESVEAIDVSTGGKNIFSASECALGYRDSIFKNEARDKYFISAIVLRLHKKPNPNLTYKVLRDHLEKNGTEPSTPGSISEAVMAIRKSKLPDPKDIGNAGSFFKNVFVTKEKKEELTRKYPEMPSFEEESSIKIPAGWLIEQCGWKGKRVGQVGVHERQALVLVNFGGATGEEVKSLAKSVINSVREKFGLELVPEVNFI